MKEEWLILYGAVTVLVVFGKGMTNDGGNEAVNHVSIWPRPKSCKYALRALAIATPVVPASRILVGFVSLGP